MGVLNYINKNNNVCITEESSFVNFRDKILSKQGINKIIDNIRKQYETPPKYWTLNLTI